MSRFCKRYICCAIIVLILIFIVYYRFFGRFHIDRIIVSSDEFIAIAYAVEEDDEINRQANNNQHLLNLTDFQYKLQPTDDVCDSVSPAGESLLGDFILKFIFSFPTPHWDEVMNECELNPYIFS